MALISLESLSLGMIKTLLALFEFEICSGKALQVTLVACSHSKA